MKLDNITEQEKRDSIINCLDKNMFVEAGAGAGKTTIIVSRIINQLMSGIKPQEIVAITFTNAATRELKGRILERASIIANDASGKYPLDKITNLKNALNELDRMQVSTIHSFCHRILSEKMFDAGLPYGFTLAEESEMEALRERYFRLWAETLKRTDYEKLLPAGRYRSGVIDRIQNLTDQLNWIPDDYSIEIAVPDMSEAEVRAELDPIIDKVCADALALVNKARGKSYGKYEDIDDEELMGYGKKLKNALIENEINLMCKTFLSLPSTKSFIVKAVTEAEMKEMGIDKKDQSDFRGKIADKDDKIRQYIKSRRHDIARLKAGYENPKFRPYIDYAKEAFKYIREKSADGIISNDQLLEKTKELVEASDDVRRFFGNKFRIIYVDEFQDTDHLQESFIRLLASDPDDQEKLRDGALFVVGDPKQSIYRFRGAEPEVYFDTKERMERLDNTYVVELADNYRSNQMIIDWVNGKFANKDITPGQSYIPMNTGKPLPVTGLPDKLIAGIYKYKNPETVQSADDIYIDRNALCMLIDSLIRNSYLIADRDKDNKVFYREIKYSDFLILCMNTPGMTEYAECLRSYGIPVIMDSKSDVSTDHDLNTFIRLYAYLASPFDKAARMGALEALHLSGADDRARNDAVLKLMTKDTEEMSAYGCVKYLMKHPELYMRKDKWIEDYLVRDMQKKLIQMTEQIKAQTYGNRLTLLNAMREYCKNRVEHELLPERDINAVRFMNLHKAKGLEGNIVIWTNRTENMAFREGEYRRGKTFYPSVYYIYKGRKNTEWSAYGGNSSLIEQARAEDESESVRLEYVAATRAKQALIFMDRYGKYDGNMFTKGYNLNSLESVEEIVKEYKADKSAAESKPYVLSGREEYLKEIKAREKQRQPVFSSESPSDYEDESAGRKHRRKDPYNDGAEDIENIDASKPVSSTGRPVGNIFGMVMHRTFELMVERWNCDPKIFENDKTTELITPCIRQAVNENIDDIADGDVKLYEDFLHDAAMAFGRWFYGSDIKKNAETIYTELPFSYLKMPDVMLKDGNTVPVWMHGEADLVVRLKDGTFFVLDYKSDSDEDYPDEDSFEERLRGKYSPQIKAYRDAVARVFKTDEGKIRAALVSFSKKNLAKGEKLRVRVTEI